MALTCPICGASAPDDALACPCCHAALDVTRRITLSDATWCPECGALVAPGKHECPKCGSSLAPERTVRAKRDLDLPDIGHTGVMGALSSDEAAVPGKGTWIESAIPPAGDESSPVARRDRIPRLNAFVLAVALAVVVMGGGVLLITHPWDPTATQTKATTPADTSKSGYPGALDRLTGQDKSSGGATSADLFESIEAAHAELGTLAEEVEQSEQALRDALSEEDASAIEEGQTAARVTSIEVSNLISDIGLLVGSTEYDEDVSNLTTLGNWLRNRCDILTAAWDAAADSDDLATDADSIASQLDSASDYSRLFSENYDLWKPERAE